MAGTRRRTRAKGRTGEDGSSSVPFTIRRPTDREVIAHDPSYSQALPGGVSADIATNMNMHSAYLGLYQLFSLFCGIGALYEGLAVKMVWGLLIATLIGAWVLVHVLYPYGVERAVVRVVDMVNTGVVATGLFALLMLLSHQTIAIYMGMMMGIFLFFVFYCCMIALALRRLVYDPYPEYPQYARVSTREP
jgi:hypothetical protein